MSNQAILWSMLILPWFTLFFMKKEDIKRFMPVALFTVITSMIIVDAGETLNWWVFRETVFPLSYSVPYILGLNPVVTMWIFKFTYGRLWSYLSVDAIFNLGFTFLLLPWLSTRGIYENIRFTGSGVFLTTTIHSILLYAYQMWQEDALVPVVKKLLSLKLQPAATKPIFDDENDKNNH